MIDPREREVLDKAMKINWVIWAAMVSSIGIYILVAHLTEGKIRVGAGIGEVFGLLRTVLLIIGIAELLLIPLIRRLMLRPSSLTPVQGATAVALTPQSHPAAARYTSALIVSLAIAESVAIYGLVLFFLSGNFGTLYLFAALGASGMIVSRPKVDELEHLATRMKTGGAA
jgi:F0F1-type ATP synthase membrane subunit c/vacuolar-type H+-ATPase subunit K